MFTGIVSGCGEVKNIEHSDGYQLLTVQLPTGVGAGCAIGASIAVDGTCLTVTERVDDTVHFAVGTETQSRSTLNFLQVGDSVNIERSLRLGDEIGGHILSGHVDGVGTVREFRVTEGNAILAISPPPALLKYLFVKGYVAISGVSLTLNELHLPEGEDGYFVCHLIPETLARTKLSTLTQGAKVNLEISRHDQVLVDSLTRWLEEKVSHSIIETLLAHVRGGGR